MNGCYVTEFQKTGMVFRGDGLTANVNDCDVTGKGLTGVTAQNGIQISDGAGGTVTDCDVAGIGYTGGGWVASGMLFYEAGNVAVTGGSVTSSQMAWSTRTRAARCRGSPSWPAISHRPGASASATPAAR